MRYALLVLLFLAGCRYTFWPPIPPEAPPPNRPVVEARVVPEGGAAVAAIRVRTVPRAGYLELSWYRDAARLAHRALFVEAPTELKVPLPYPGEGSYRLVLRWEGEPVAAVLYGTPTPPKATPPEWKEN